MTTVCSSRRPVLLLCLLAASLLVFSGCAKPRQPPLPVGDLKLGVAFFTQPSGPADMLAGYVVEDVPRIDDKVLVEMDALLAGVLAAESKNSFHSRDSALNCSKKVASQGGRTNNQAALRTWSSVGRCMGVDLLVVPQLFEYRDRAGSAVGMTEPAKVVMDIFVIYVRNETLISRSRFDEAQSALSSNLLEADKFFKRGGKWITGHDLAKEGMEIAVKELRL